LEWARKGCPWDEQTCTFAAASGNLDTLVWARQHGCPWSESVLVFAVKHRHLHVLTWVHANGCPRVSDRVCNEAAELGYVDLLEWARANGCAWSAKTYGIAEDRIRNTGDDGVLRFCIEHSCPGAAA
jgi:hypothetical protein